MRNHPPGKIRWEAILADPSLLRALLEYDASTGELTWKKRPREAFRHEGQWQRFNKKFAGSCAGHKSATDGYVRLSFGAKGRPTAHRVAWAIAYGVWPSGEIDHINRDRSDNRLNNLRCVSHVENCRNKSFQKSRKTAGITGVSFEKQSGKWFSYIGVDGKLVNLGRYACFFQAAKARKNAERLYGFDENHGKVKQ